MSSPASVPGLPSGLVVLDASFVIALLEGDPAAAAHAEVLARGVVSALTLGEVHEALSQRAGIEPVTTEQGLRALGATLVDLPVAAAAHLPALRAAEAAGRVAQTDDGEGAAVLSIAELTVLAHAMATGLPVLTGNTGQAALAVHGLGLDVHHYSRP